MGLLQFVVDIQEEGEKNLAHEDQDLRIAFLVYDFRDMEILLLDVIPELLDAFRLEETLGRVKPLEKLVDQSFFKVRIGLEVFEVFLDELLIVGEVG